MLTMCEFINQVGYGHRLRHVPRSWRSIWQLCAGWLLAEQTDRLKRGWAGNGHMVGLPGWETGQVPLDPETDDPFDARTDRALVLRREGLEVAAWEWWEDRALHQDAMLTAYAGKTPERPLLGLRVSAVAWKHSASYAKVTKVFCHDWRPYDEALTDRLVELWDVAQILNLDVDPMLVAIAMARDELRVVDAYEAEALCGSVPSFLVANPCDDLRIVAGLRGMFADRWMILYGDNVIRRGLHSDETVWKMFPSVPKRPVTYYDLSEHERLILDDEWDLGSGDCVWVGSVPYYTDEKAIAAWEQRQPERDTYGEVMPK